MADTPAKPHILMSCQCEILVPTYAEFVTQVVKNILLSPDKAGEFLQQLKKWVNAILDLNSEHAHVTV